MIEQFAPGLVAIGFILWPIMKSAVFLVALFTSLHTKNERRRARAERVLRILCGGPV